MNISLRAACVGGLVFLAVEIAPGAFSGAPGQWGGWSPIASAHAYKVEQVCEEKQTRRGPEKKCRSVLVQAKAVEKKDAPAGDKKDAHSKDPHSSGPAKH